MIKVLLLSLTVLVLMGCCAKPYDKVPLHFGLYCLKPHKSKLVDECVTSNIAKNCEQQVEDIKNSIKNRVGKNSAKTSVEEC